MPKDRGSEQGHVDGQTEYSLALGIVAAEARSLVARQQAAGPWVGANNMKKCKDFIVVGEGPLLYNMLISFFGTGYCASTKKPSSP